MANGNTNTNDNTKLDIDNRLYEYEDTPYINKTLQNADIIKGIYDTKPEAPVDDKYDEINSQNCSANSTIVDILNLNTIRGGSKMINGGGCGCAGMSGGCLSCKKGVKNIMVIYKTVHVIIPELYSKYKKDADMKGITKKVKKQKNKTV